MDGTRADASTHAQRRLGANALPAAVFHRSQSNAGLVDDALVGRQHIPVIADALGDVIGDHTFSCTPADDLAAVIGHPGASIWTHAPCGDVRAGCAGHARVARAPSPADVLISQRRRALVATTGQE